MNLGNRQFYEKRLLAHGGEYFGSYPKANFETNFWKNFFQESFTLSASPGLAFDH